MKPVPVPSQACFCIDNQQNSGSDTEKVEVWLEESIFTHGQFYVAVSWIADPQHLHLAVSKSVRRKTRNVVYRQIL